MSHTTNPLVLANDSGFNGPKQEIYNPTHTITDNFVYAKVSNNDQPKSFYVVYTVPNFASDESGTSYLVPPNVLSGSSTTIQANSNIRSAQGFDVTVPGLILFEHINYKGYGQKYVISDQDINSSFPVGKREGASSAVVTGGKWRLWTKKGMQGAYIDLTVSSPLTPSFVALDINDRVQSVHRLIATACSSGFLSARILNGTIDQLIDLLISLRMHAWDMCIVINAVYRSIVSLAFHEAIARMHDAIYFNSPTCRYLFISTRPGLSRLIWSARNFGPGPKFSGNIGPRGPKFPGKNCPNRE